MQRDSQTATDVLHRIRLLNVLSGFLTLISPLFVFIIGMELTLVLLPSSMLVEQGGSSKD